MKFILLSFSFLSSPIFASSSTDQPRSTLKYEITRKDFDTTGLQDAKSIWSIFGEVKKNSIEIELTVPTKVARFETDQSSGVEANLINKNGDNIGRVQWAKNLSYGFAHSKDKNPPKNFEIEIPFGFAVDQVELVSRKFYDKTLSRKVFPFVFHLRNTFSKVPLASYRAFYFLHFWAFDGLINDIEKDFEQRRYQHVAQKILDLQKLVEDRLDPEFRATDALEMEKADVIAALKFTQNWIALYLAGDKTISTENFQVTKPGPLKKGDQLQVIGIPSKDFGEFHLVVDAKLDGQDVRVENFLDGSFRIQATGLSAGKHTLVINPYKRKKDSYLKLLHQLLRNFEENQQVMSDTDSIKNKEILIQMEEARFSSWKKWEQGVKELTGLKTPNGVSTEITFNVQ